MGCTTQSKIAIKTNEIDLTNGDLDEIFKLFDNKNDKKITAEEIQTTIQSYGVSVPLKQIQILIYCADKNGNGTIQRSEIKRLVELIFNFQNIDDELTKAVDINQSDSIQIDEFVQMKQKLGWDIPVPDKTITDRSFKDIIKNYIQQ
ncbi:Calmodulin [Hexamita inflata]|uniref:Calmodulin n=1 Tax=Hexamita inflata TaxID=28002 RepID=A0AA86TR83_9EUKA|nr:Calmodulin [Hexamita inflata]